MAYNLGSLQEREAGGGDFLSNLRKIEWAVVTAPSSHPINVWRRQLTKLMVAIASHVAVARANVDPLADWRPGPDCSDVQAALLTERTAADSDGTTLDELIARSYARDLNSQRARVALRSRPPEALDVYFLPDDENDTGELSPALVRFRERSLFQLTGV